MGAEPAYSTPPQTDDQPPARLRLLSYNIQAATATGRYHHYFLHGWKQVLPHSERGEVLDAIAAVVAEYDIVGLQEADAGSLRSGFINQVEYLAERGQFPFWYHQLNRRVGKIACASNGLLSRIPPEAVEEHRLPGAIPGRGALWVRFGSGNDEFVVAIVHLALGKRAREMQLYEIAERLREWPRVVVMGDLNASAGAPEVRRFLKRTGLAAAGGNLRTFPSWRPQRGLDHILVSPECGVEDYQSLECTLSDHRPVSVSLKLPRHLATSVS